MNSGQLSENFSQNVNKLDTLLRIQENFDLVGRSILIGSRRAKMYFADGFVKDDVMEKIMEFIMGLDDEKIEGFDSAPDFSEKFITYVETDVTGEREKIVTGVLSGMIALIVEGFSKAILIDARTYPSRDVREPDDDRVLRGARDGFLETMVFNTALIRRRIRDPNLTMEILQIGSKSKTDVTLCYMAGTAN